MSETTIPRNRDFVIDNAKLICLFLILFCHIPPTKGVFHAIVYLFHVPIFFLISGMFFKQKPLVDVIKSSARSLLIPYLIFNLLLIAIYSGISVLGHYGFTARSHIIEPIIGILLGSTAPLAPYKIPGGPSWFLVALFVDRVVFSVLLSSSKTARAIISGCLIAVFVLIYNFASWCMFSIHSALLGLPFMVVGYMIKDKLGVIASLSTTIKAALIIVLAGVLYIIAGVNGVSDLFAGKYGEYFILFILGGIAGSLFIYLSSTFINASNRASRLFIEGSTFFICMHIMVMEYVSLVYRRSLGVVGELLTIDKIIIFILTVLIIYLALLVIRHYLPQLLQIPAPRRSCLEAKA